MAVPTVERSIGKLAASDAIAPLSERILARFGPPRTLWLIAWGCLASVGSVIADGGLQGSGFSSLILPAATAYLNIVSLWGIGSLTQRMRALQPLIEELVGAPATDPRTHPFRLVSSTAGPVVLTLVTAPFWGTGLLSHPGALATTATLLLAVGWLPAHCMMWVCLTIFAGLYRLGGQHLRLRPFHQDRTLGLAPLGQLATSALTILVVVGAPFLLATARDRESTLVTLGHFVVALALFVLSLYGLHTQLASAKREYFVQVRRLFAEAFAPVETNWSLESLSGQASRINAAKALEQHVGTIQSWPIGESVIARVVAIGTSVVTAIVVRIVIAKF